MRAIAVVTLLVAFTLPVSAQPGLTPPVEPPVVIESPPPKSPWAATAWAVGGTGLAAAAFFVAVETESPELGWASLGLFAVGPSAGHIYAGEYAHALATSALRTGGMALFVAGMIKQSEQICYTGYECAAISHGGEAMAWIGGLTFLGVAFYDFYDAHRAAERTNAKARTWTVAPTIIPGVNGRAAGPTVGIGLSAEL